VWVVGEWGAGCVWNQECPRFRLEIPEIFPQPFDGLPVARHRTRLFEGLTVNVSTSRALKKGLRKTPRFQGDRPGNGQLIVVQVPSGLRQAVPRALCGV